jgi:uncharacterized protein (UPF0335 family)
MATVTKIRPDNDGDDKQITLPPKKFAARQLKSIVERVVRLEEEKKALASDISEIYAEAKGIGFDVKIVRKVVKLAQMDKADRQEEQALIELYLEALGL